MDAGALVYVPDATYGWLPATVVSDASGGASRSGGGGATTTTVTVRLDGDPSTMLPRGVACGDGDNAAAMAPAERTREVGRMNRFCSNAQKAAIYLAVSL